MKCHIPSTISDHGVSHEIFSHEIRDRIAVEL